MCVRGCARALRSLEERLECHMRCVLDGREIDESSFVIATLEGSACCAFHYICGTCASAAHCGRSGLAWGLDAPNHLN